MTDPRLDLFGRLKEAGETGVPFMPNRLDELPVGLYTDEDWFDREKQMLFSDGPVSIGHASMLKQAGDHFVHDHLGVPILVVRGKDDQVRAFLNVCRHRGVRLANGEGVSRKPNFVCPYHHWVYGLDGSLTSVPLEESLPGLDKGCRGLTSLPCEVRHGFIWVNPNPEGALDLNGFLGSLNQDLERFGCADQVFFEQSIKHKKTNWKLIIEAFQDGYHVQRLHNKTVGPFFIDGLAALEREGSHIRSVVARNEFEEALSLAPEAWDTRHHVTYAYYVFPNTVLIFHPDYMSHLAVYPQAPDETTVIHTCLIPNEPANAKEQAHWERAFNIIENGVFEAEDLFICEQAQIGMASGANDTLLVGGHEQGLRVFHEILTDRMGPYPGG